MFMMFSCLGSLSCVFSSVFVSTCRMERQPPLARRICNAIEAVFTCFLKTFVVTGLITG